MGICRLGSSAPAARQVWLGMAGAGLAFALSGCASQTVQRHYAHGHEYFSQAKYGHASPKVIADGEPVPKGGGQYLVGHPYRIAGHTYVPAENDSYSAVGMASWYGAAFHGRRTANGEIYDMASITAAHPTMPLPSYARVTNLGNGYSVIVRVNDRGPYHGGRVMDVSSRAADLLGFKGEGTAKVRVDYVGQAPLGGSDDGVLLASLRTDGSPATLDGYSSPVMIAGAFEPGSGLFAGLFGSGRTEAASARPARRRPEPEPILVAAAPPPPPEPIPEPESVREAPSSTAVAFHRPHGPVPLPPARPFDLGASHIPTVVATAGRMKPSSIAVLPPRRRLLQASAEKALYFADGPAERVERLTKGAFERLNSAKE